MLSMFFQTLYSAVDAVWVGRISPDAIAAVGISQITLFIMLSATLGISVGSGVIMAMAIGRRDTPEAGRILGQSFVLNFGAAIVFTTIALLLRTQLLTATGATGTIMPLAKQYFTITAGGSVLMFVFFAVVFGFNAQGDNRTVTILFATSSVLNSILDPALIFGWWIFPEMGIRGAAIATLTSQFVMLVLGLVFLAYRPMMIKFRIRNLNARWSSVRRVFSIGLPAAITNMMAPIAFGVLTAVIASAFKEPGAVAFAIGFRVEFFGFLPAVGFGVASLALIGQNLGAKDIVRARASYRTAIIFAFTLGTIIGAGAAILSRLVVRIFTDDPLIGEYARSYLRTVPLTYGVYAVSFVAISSFQALGKSWSGVLINAIRLSLLLGLGIAISRASVPNIRELWWVVIGANIVSAVVGFLLLQRRFRNIVLDAPERESSNAVA